MEPIRGKRKNHRLFPGIKGKRPDHFAGRKEEGLARQASYDQLTIQQKIERLDVKLGVGVGAVKQRARLAALLTQPSEAQKARAERLQQQIDTAISGEAAPTDSPREITDRAAQQQKELANRTYMKGSKKNENQ